MRISRRLFLTLGALYASASILVIVLVHYAMHQQAIQEAEAKALIFLDQNLSIHTYFSQQLKPEVLKWSQAFRPPEYFEPTWMSSTHAVREIDNYYKKLSNDNYYYKEAAVNARTPANEADDFEKKFIAELQIDPNLTYKSLVRHLDGKPFFVVLRRGEQMEESCLLCHSSPEMAPAQLVQRYGPERSFNRHAGEVVTAISIRVPLAAAFSEARRFSILLSGFLTAVFILLFSQQVWLSRRWVFKPLAAIRDKALQIAGGAAPLGATISLPPGQELRDMAEAFNSLSQNLKRSHDGKEETINSRTGELYELTTRLQEDIARRKSIEQALRQSQSLLDAFLVHTPSIMYIKDLEGRYLMGNRWLAEIVGRPQKEISGRTDSDFFPSEIANQLRANDLKALAASQPLEFEEYFASDADRHVFWSTKFPLYDDNGLAFAVAGVSRDITQRKQAEQAILASEEKFRSLVENIPGIVYRCEAYPPWRVEYLSERMLDFCGYPASEFLNGSRNYLEIIVSVDLPRVTREVREAISRRQPYELEYTIHTAQGEIRWVRERGRCYYDSAGQPQFLDGVLFDITARKRIENALLETEASFRTLFEHVADIVILHDGERIIDGNREACQVLGYDRQELQGLVLSTIEVALDDEAVFEKSGSKGFKACQGRFRRQDGSTFPVELRTSYFKNNGTTLRLVSARDITARLQAEEENALQESQLRQRQKLEALGTLAGGIAHDFNNILMVILGYAEIAKQNLPRNSADRENLVEVIRAANRARELVRQILAFSRRSSGELKPVRVKPMVQEALRMMRAMLPSTIEVHQELKSDGCVVMDPAQIHQIIINLCNNAAQAMHDKGGRLAVLLDDITIQGGRQARSLEVQPGSFVHLTVRDTGPGIPPELLNRIFEPYFTTKALGEGTGLGLAVVHGIVKEHKGGITVESTYDQGATFHVYLPSLQQFAQDLPKAEAASPPLRGTEHILFVDDEPAIRQLSKNILESLGYVVTICDNGAQALELCRQEPDTYDLVITDQTMPGLTGLELAQALQDLKPDLPVFLCTGYSQDITSETVKSAGIRELILKPMVISDLSEKIRKVFSGKA